MTRKLDGTIVTCSGTSTGYLWLIDNTLRHSTNCIIEFDIVEQTHRGSLGLFKDGTNRIDFEFNSLGSNKIGHYKYVITPTEQKIYKDNNLITGQSYTFDFSGTFRIGWQIIYNNSLTSYLKFANFTICKR